MTTHAYPGICLSCGQSAVQTRDGAVVTRTYHPHTATRYCSAAFGPGDIAPTEFRGMMA
jgi:hypothetical protein